MIRKILVPVRGDGKGDNVLRHAAVLAHEHHAHISVTHCRARPEDLMPFGVPLPRALRDQILKQSYRVADLEEENLRAELTALGDALRLAPSRGPADNIATVAYVEEVGRQVDVIKRRGRLADVIAVPQPDHDNNLGSNTLKAALFHSGRPVLMCPERPDAPETLGKRVAIAWNGSAEAARALAQSLRLLDKAEEVFVLSSGEDVGAGTSAEDVLEYLASHHVEAKIHAFEARRSAGDAILKACSELGADLLVMGAYGDSHERETIFGGNTQTIVERARLPVLLSH